MQSRLASNVRDALSGTDLPPGAADKIASSVSGGEFGGSAAETGGPDAAQIQSLIEGAFADAVNTAFLWCAAVAVLGAIVALFFSPSGKAKAVGEEKYASQEH